MPLLVGTAIDPCRWTIPNSSREKAALAWPPGPSKFWKCSSQTTPSLWRQVNWPGGFAALVGLVDGVQSRGPLRASADESTPSSDPASAAEGTWPSFASLTSRPSRLSGLTCFEPTLLDPKLTGRVGAAAERDEQGDDRDDVGEVQVARQSADGTVR